MRRGLLILALLAAGCGRGAGSANVGACSSNLKDIGAALSGYQHDHGGALPKSLNELAPKYLKSLPTCPAAHSDTYSGSYTQAKLGADIWAYTVFCQGANHTDLLSGRDFPQYTSYKGAITPFKTRTP